MSLHLVRKICEFMYKVLCASLLSDYYMVSTFGAQENYMNKMDLHVYTQVKRCWSVLVREP